MMKKVNALLLGLFIAFSFSCGDDDDGGPSGPQEEDFVGVWVLANVNGEQDKETQVGNTVVPNYTKTYTLSASSDFTLSLSNNPNTVEGEGSYTLITSQVNEGSDDEIDDTESYDEDDEFFGLWSLDADTDSLVFTSGSTTRSYEIVSVNSNQVVLRYNDVLEEPDANSVARTTTQLEYTFTKQ